MEKRKRGRPQESDIGGLIDKTDLERTFDVHSRSDKYNKFNLLTGIELLFEKKDLVTPIDPCFGYFVNIEKQTYKRVIVTKLGEVARHQSEQEALRFARIIAKERMPTEKAINFIRTNQVSNKSNRGLAQKIFTIINNACFTEEEMIDFMRLMILLFKDEINERKKKPCLTT